jgi:hypothetical protein
MCEDAGADRIASAAVRPAAGGAFDPAARLKSAIPELK